MNSRAKTHRTTTQVSSRAEPEPATQGRKTEQRNRTKHESKTTKQNSMSKQQRSKLVKQAEPQNNSSEQNCKARQYKQSSRSKPQLEIVKHSKDTRLYQTAMRSSEGKPLSRPAMKKNQ